MEFIVENLPIIICAVVGIALLVVEMFMPGFGVPGVAGMILLLASIVLTWRDHGAYAGLGATLVVLSVAGIMITMALKSASSGRIWRSSLVLRDSMRGAQELPEGKALESLLGRGGQAQTMLRPAGIALIDGQRVNVVSRGEIIEQGAHIVVDEVEGSRVVVRRAAPNA